MSEDGRLRAGRAIAETVARAWRPEVATSPSSEGLADLVPLLVRGGVGALAWRRIRQSEAARWVGFRPLRQVSRFNALEAALQRRALRDAVSALGAAGIAALLGKGLAAAALYAEPGLRPAGDIDLYVPAAQAAAARAALADLTGAAIDLHEGAAELDDRRWDEVFERSTTIAVDGVPARTFGREDHLRLMALHMLRHGAWRPLWLCDVAAAAESAAGLDWDRVLGGHRRRADAVVCALGLAQELLGARLVEAPAAVRSRRLPRWIVPAVLQQWGDPRLEPQSRRRPFVAELARPARMLTALVQRWPGAVEATLNVGAPFDDVPRLPFQLLECVRRTALFVQRAH
jgi:Uncharacterised nucleotidyltransferase